MREGKPSRTSGVVAKGLVYTYHAYSELGLVSSETAKWAGRFLEELERGRLLKWHRLFRFPLARYFFRLVEKCGIPGLALHQSIRKHLIATETSKLLGDENNALVVIGGGLDSLALQQSAASSRQKIVELDHPSTQQVKKTVLQSYATDASALQLAEFDASKDSLHEVLACLDSASIKQGVFICEGVLMYLPEEKVRNLLEQVATAAPKVTLIFTFMDQSHHGSWHFAEATMAARAWLRLVGEPFMWGCPKSELGSFLSECGLQLVDILDTRDWRVRGDSEHGLPVASGEYLAIAKSH
tara:strand:+ start:58 stop:951 length:894 start_codon:yes stop_codon:yes gene_type:complete